MTFAVARKIALSDLDNNQNHTGKTGGETTVNVSHKILIGAAVLGALGISSQASASIADTFYLDRLTVEKCLGSAADNCTDTTIYDNGFDGSFSGAATPSTVNFSNGAGSVWGGTLGSTFSEGSGHLALGGDQTVTTVAAINGNLRETDQAQLQTPKYTNTNALGKGRGFSAVSLWDLAAPSADSTRYGMRFNDQNASSPLPTDSNDIIDISVVNHGGTSYIEVRDLLADGTPAGDNLLTQVSLDLLSGFDQVALQLAWDALNNVLTASYAYSTSGVLASWQSLGSYSGVLFSDDSYTRVRVYASGQPATSSVPSPQAWLLLGIGLAALRLRRHGERR